MNGFEMPTIAEFCVSFGSALVCAGLAFILLTKSRRVPQDTSEIPIEPMAFLFDNGLLHHASPNALRSFALVPGSHVWSDLRDGLLDRFPQFPEDPHKKTLESMSIRSANTDDPAVLSLHWQDQRCWVELYDGHPDHQQDVRNAPHLYSMEAACDTCPHPSWETDKTGAIRWHNLAYEKLRKDCGSPADGVIFETLSQEDTYRVPVKFGTGTTEWYEEIGRAHV